MKLEFKKRSPAQASLLVILLISPTWLMAQSPTAAPIDTVNLITSEPIPPPPPLVDLFSTDPPSVNQLTARPLVPIPQPDDVDPLDVTKGIETGPDSHYCPRCGLAKPEWAKQSIGIRTQACPTCRCDVHGRPSDGPDVAFRFGWWGVESDGSPVKVGEYQDLASSPFWDLDGVWTNGRRTLDFTLTGLDNEANDTRGYFYGGPGLAVKFEYERFLRRLDHIPLSGFDLNSGTPAATDKVVADDLNVGSDYAIRVQKLETRAKGRLTNNLKWKV
ncbi:MAG: hypothetical protein KDB00_25995, partial [Planctomycetales bacterium]|nr:hypothetical protein [Planctomycetales bacterium]